MLLLVLAALASLAFLARRLRLEGAALLGEIGNAAHLEERTGQTRESCANAGVPPFDS